MKIDYRRQPKMRAKKASSFYPSHDGVTWVLGIHLGHDASVTLLENGVPRFCASEERFVREKGWRGFPFRALQRALHSRRLSAESVAVVAISTEESCWRLSALEMRHGLADGRSRRLLQELLTAEQFLSYFLGRRAALSLRRELTGPPPSAKILEGELRRLGFQPQRIRFFDHHYCHAIAGFELSPFERSLIVTSDGRGDGLSATVGVVSDAGYQRLATVPDTSSLGQFYGAVTAFLGFRCNRHEGKITGLAAFGDRERIGPALLKMLSWSPDGTYRLRLPERFSLASPSQVNEFLKSLSASVKDRVLLHSQRDLAALLYKANWLGALAFLSEIAGAASREDVAAGVQWMAEVAMTRLVEHFVHSMPQDVALSGGVFANVRINQRIAALRNVRRVFVQPAMGDEGLSLGAALAAQRELLPQEYIPNAERPASIGHTYLGPSYTDAELRRTCVDENVSVFKSPDVASWTARAIARGLVIGHFSGPMEFGPRALGNRSILASPANRQLNALLNNRLRRTDFMPFAPSILAEHASEYLTNYSQADVASEYMTLSYDVVTRRRSAIPGVVHVDGTARPQVVHSSRAPRLYRILEAFRALSGVPVLVNTSFNMHEEPIVCSPQDAIRALKADCVDAVVFDDLVVLKNGALGNAVVEACSGLPEHCVPNA